MKQHVHRKWPYEHAEKDAPCDHTPRRFTHSLVLSPPLGWFSSVEAIFLADWNVTIPPRQAKEVQRDRCRSGVGAGGDVFGSSLEGVVDKEQTFWNFGIECTDQIHIQLIPNLALLNDRIQQPMNKQLLNSV